MPANCALLTCKVTSRDCTATRKISFHQFPKDPEIKKQWIANCKRTDEKFNVNHATVCMYHFQKDDFERDLRAELLKIPPKRKLKKGVVPTLFLETNPKARNLELLLYPQEYVDHLDTTNICEDNIEKENPIEVVEIKREATVLEMSQPAAPMNLSKTCRICLTENESMQSIYGKMLDCEELDTLVEYGDLTLDGVITKITSIPIEQSDDHPNQVCNACVQLIHIAYKFKLQFDQSNEILQEYLSANTLKNEPDVKSELEVEECEIESESRSQGRRRTSRKQIEKRDKPTKRKTRRKPKEVQSTDEEESEWILPTTSSVRLHPCPICTKEFPALELREHAHTHTALKKYLSIPEKHKIKSDYLQFHTTGQTNTINIHYRDIKLHKCDICGAELTAMELRTHISTHRNEKDYKCDKCERVFKQLNHLNTHRVKHLKEFPFKCEHCGKGFVIATNYECHVLTHNTEQELPHECSHCYRRFSNPEHLNRHIIIHTENVSYSVKYKVCKCSHCLKTFKDRDQLKAHTCIPISHKSQSKFSCKICSKVYKNATGLYHHKRTIHKLKGAKMLCSVCGHYVTNIYNHMMRHNGQKPFQCNQCGKRFLGKPQLRQHLLVHSGVKPYVCSVCAKAFNNLYNLQVHERIHKGDRCHICNICGKGFLEKSYLKKHMNVHKNV